MAIEKKHMQIIGLTGTLGAGKGTVVDYLIEKYHFQHFSVRSFLIKEIEKKGLTVNRDSMVVVANNLRANFSPSYIVDELYKEAMKIGQNAIIESIRTPGEITSLKQKGNFVLFAVNADPEIRYERIVLRNSETDHISFDTFLENEKREMTTTDPNKQNLAECIRQADFVFNNNFVFSDLYRQIDDCLTQLGYIKN